MKADRRVAASLFMAFVLPGMRAAAGQQTAPASRPTRPTVGAIRWDAWFGNEGTVGEAVHRSLRPAKWHYRLPFYAKVLAADTVEIDGTPQPVIDREIEYAAAAGLDYWAFVQYPEKDRLSLAIKRYLSSPVRSKLNFCLVTECGRWPEQAFVDRVVRLMQEPGYQRVIDGRPLLYLGFIKPEHLKTLGGTDGFRRRLDAFRADAASKRLPKPYIVIMDFDPAQGRKWAQALGCDAISSYVAGVGAGAVPYRSATENVERFWEQCRATGSQVVPIVVTGWDPRPRVERPMPWGNPYSTHNGEVDRMLPATPAEIAAHLQNALRWLDTHREGAAAQTAIIYAWNEFDEGGWLAPTLSEGSARLDAVARILRPASLSRPDGASARR